jgi:hypothetical protein
MSDEEYGDEFENYDDEVFEVQTLIAMKEMLCIIEK